MTILRSLGSSLMSWGVISPGWYSILTGLAMLYLAYVLGSGPADEAAAVVGAVVLTVTGVWQLERGLRAEFQRRRAG